MANGDLFGELTYKPYVSQYVGAPVKEVFDLSVIARERADQNIEARDNLDNYLDTLQAVPGAYEHQRILEEEKNKYERELARIADAPPEFWAKAGPLIRSLVTDLKNNMAHGKMSTILGSRQVYDDKKKELSEMDPEELHEGYLYSTGYGAELLQFQEQGGIDPKTGELIALDPSSRWHPYMDTSEYLGKRFDDIKDTRETIYGEVWGQTVPMGVRKGVTKRQIGKEAVNMVEGFFELPEPVQNQLLVDYRLLQESMSDEDFRSMTYLYATGPNSPFTNDQLSNIDWTDPRTIDYIGMVMMLADHGERYIRTSSIEGLEGTTTSSGEGGQRYLFQGATIAVEQKVFVPEVDVKANKRKFNHGMDKLTYDKEDRIVSGAKLADVPGTKAFKLISGFLGVGPAITGGESGLTTDYTEGYKVEAIRTQLKNLQNRARGRASLATDPKEKEWYEGFSKASEKGARDKVDEIIESAEHIYVTKINLSAANQDGVTKQLFSSTGLGIATQQKVKIVGSGKGWESFSDGLGTLGYGKIFGRKDRSKAIEEMRKGATVTSVMPYAGGGKGGIFVVSVTYADGTPATMLVEPSAEQVAIFSKSATLLEAKQTGLDKFFIDGNTVFLTKAIPGWDPITGKPKFETFTTTYDKRMLRKNDIGDWDFDSVDPIRDENTGEIKSYSEEDLIDMDIQKFTLWEAKQGIYDYW